MIEPYITEKQCRTCGECKPLTMFSPSKRSYLGTQPYCKPCRSAMISAKKRVDKKRGRQGEANPTAWIMPSMSMVQSLHCIQFRKWQGVVSRPAEFRALGAGL